MGDNIKDIIIAGMGFLIIFGVACGAAGIYGFWRGHETHTVVQVEGCNGVLTSAKPLKVLAHE